MNFKPRFDLILFGAALALGALVLEGLGINRDVWAAIFLAAWFVAMMLYRAVVWKTAPGVREIVLGLPVLLACILVILNELNVMRINSGIIWISAVVLFVLALGYTAPERFQ